MNEKPPEGIAWDADQTWRALGKVVRFGDRLDFVFLESASIDTYCAWRDALREHCRAKKMPFREPLPGQKVLDWLEGERARGVLEDLEKGEDRPREVYIGTIPQDADERTVFGRINENRDNLVRALNGVLILAGTGDFVRRLAYAAPSVWAMRTKSFSLEGPPPSEVAVRAKSSFGLEIGGAAPAPPPFAGRLPATPAAALPAPALAPTLAEVAVLSSAEQSVDVLLSCAGHDEAAARDLKKRLEAEGFQCAIAMDGVDLSALEAARVVVVLLSSNYAYSKSWDALAGTPMALNEPSVLRAKLVPILLQDAVIPGLMSGLTPLDFRTPESRARDYGRLMRTLRGERDPSEGPGLAPARYESAGDSSWLDGARLDWSHPAARELLDLLVDAYPSREERFLIVSRAGVPPGRIGWSLPPRLAWMDIFADAHRYLRLRSLFDVLLQDDRSAALHERIRDLTRQSAPSS